MKYAKTLILVGMSVFIIAGILLVNNLRLEREKAEILQRVQTIKAEMFAGLLLMDSLYRGDPVITPAHILQKIGKDSITLKLYLPKIGEERMRVVLRYSE